MRRSRLAMLTTVAVGAVAALTLNAVVASGDDGSKHFKLFENFESMTTLNEQDNVPGFEDATLQVCLIIVEKVHAQFSPFNKERFLSHEDLAGDRLMDVRLNNFASWVSHIGELL